MENTAAKKGHPKGLYVLFVSEMWERFCYYGMRALLLLYLVESLLKGDAEGYLVYGTYTALVYMAPVLGGKIADELIGYKNAVLLGGILMAIGEFLILGGTEMMLYAGMAAIIVGNGYFKANISSIVGKLYEDGDPRRDSGFTIFYIGINVGALLATTVCAWVGETYGYHYGFALAGFGMIIGTLVFFFGRNTYEHVSSPPNVEKLHEKWIGPLSRLHVVYIGSILLIPVIYLMINFHQVMPYLLTAVSLYVVYTLMTGGIKEGKIYRDRMIAMLIIFFFNIVFWACFEQAGTSLTLFAKRNVDRMLGGWEVPASVTQSFNPAYIIIFGTIFSMMWIALEKRKLNPSIPLKFGLGIIQLGLGFLVIILGGMFLDGAYLVPLWTLAGLYLLHTTGELFLSPIGLSMVTKLAPKHMTGTAMGGWFLSFALSNYAAALIATLTGVGGHGGGDEEKKPDPTFAEIVTEVKALAPQIKENAQKVVMTAKDLEANKAKLESKDDPNQVKIPSELQKMAAAAGPNFERIQAEVFPILQDTSKYNGERKINWNNAMKDYYAAVQDVNKSLIALNTLSAELASGAKDFSKVEDEFGGAVNDVGGGFDALNKKVIDRLTKNNKGFAFPQAEAAYKAWGKEYSTIAAHMSWNKSSSVFVLIGIVIIGIGIFLCAISGLLNKLMHGVK